MPERLNHFSVAARVPDFADSVANLASKPSAHQTSDSRGHQSAHKILLERPLRARGAVAGVASGILTRVSWESFEYLVMPCEEWRSFLLKLADAPMPLDSQIFHPTFRPQGPGPAGAIEETLKNTQSDCSSKMPFLWAPSISPKTDENRSPGKLKRVAAPPKKKRNN